MKYNQIEIINLPSKLISVLEDQLSEMNPLSTSIQNHTDHEIFESDIKEHPLWEQCSLKILFPFETNMNAIIGMVEEIIPSDTSYQVSLLNDKDWINSWKQDLNPLIFNNRLMVHSSAIKTPISDLPNIVIDPGLAFGTGYHPTTNLCLNWLAMNEIKNKVVVDYGCGSGILAIAALKLGAKKVIAIDNDPSALEVTIENAKQNKVNESKLSIHSHDAVPKHLNADILTANILARPLIELSNHFCQILNNDGVICLSGILTNQENDIHKTYSKEFTFVDISEKDGWISIIGQKKSM